MSRASSRKPKDMHAPKRNLTAYFLFMNGRRPQLKSEKPEITNTELTKLIASEWKSMDESTKQTWQEKAAEDKQRYQSEFEAYKKTENFEKFQQKLSEWKLTEKAMGRDGNNKATKGKKGKKPKKPKQPQSMPKRPQSSYFLFSNERRNQLKEQYPDKKITELAKLIGDEWKTKTAEEKKVYEDKHAVNKEQYVKNMEEYKKTEEYTEYMQSVDNYKKAMKEWENPPANDAMDIADGDKLEIKKKKLPKKPKDDQCPKRPLTSYFLYAQKVRASIKSEGEKMSTTEIAKEISKRWKELNEEEKKVYNDEAAENKEKYKKILDEYKESDAYKAYQEKVAEWKLKCKQIKAENDELERKMAQRINVEQNRMKQRMRQRMDESDSDTSSSSDSDSDSDSSSGSTSSGSTSSSSSSSESSSDDDMDRNNMHRNNMNGNDYMKVNNNMNHYNMNNGNVGYNMNGMNKPYDE